MQCEGLRELRGDLVGRVEAGVEAQVRDFAVHGFAQRGQIAQHLFAIATRQQRPAAVVRQALQLCFDADVQVHDEAAAAQQLAVVWVDHRAAAGGDDHAVVVPVAVQGFLQQCPFARTESGFALALEDQADAGAGARLDLAIDVDQPQSKALRQLARDVRLAGAHGADQDQVAGAVLLGVHLAIVASPAPHGVPMHGVNGGGRRVGLPVQLGSIGMSVAKVIELNAASKTGIEDAVKVGLKKCAESVKNIQGAWVHEIKVVTDGQGAVQEWRVNLRVTFVVE